MIPPINFCHHCDEPIRGSSLQAYIEGEDRLFCCQGCLSVSQLIHGEGLVGFYRHRTAPLTPPEALNDQVVQEFRLYDHPELQHTYVQPFEDEQLEATLLITGMSCAACIWLIEKHLQQHPGVTSLSINHTTQRARLVWQPAQARLSDILLAIRELGFGIRPFQADEADKQLQSEQKRAILRLCLAGIGTMQSMMLAIPLYFGLINDVTPTFQQFFRYISWLVATPVILYSAAPFFRAAWRDLRTRHLTMDVPVAMGIGAAYLSSAWITVFGGDEVYFDAVCMFTFFLTLGRFLEQRARVASGLSGQALAQLIPPVARKIQSNGEQMVPSHTLLPGDLILIRPGEVIPADGHITEGSSSVNEASLTGEYLPENKTPGQTVIAGTVNGEGPLTVNVSRAGKDTRLSAILRILDRAQQEKPRTALIADRMSRFFVARVLIISALVYLGWTLAGADNAFDITLSVLVVTCPCALSLATPTALTAATARLRNMGFLPTRGHTLEALAEIDTLVFDKTGTLTEGNLQLTHAIPLSSMSIADCLLRAATLEQHSEHPVANAFRRYPKAQAESVQNFPGGGLRGKLAGQNLWIGHEAFIRDATGLPAAPGSQHPGPVIFLASEAGWLARFELDDGLREDALSTVQALTDMNIRSELLSGDRSAHVAGLAKQLGLQHFLAGASPEAKLAYLKQREQEGHQLAMIGDGINDLPVMAGARLSIAMGSAADVTQLKADAILLNNQLSVIPEAIRIGKATRKIIRQNLSWALGYNLLALPLAIAGLVPPWAAAIGMSASSLVVVVNALRLGRMFPASPHNVTA